MLVFEQRGDRSTRRKTIRYRVENQKTQPTYDADFQNRTRATLEARIARARLTILDLLISVKDLNERRIFYLLSEIDGKPQRILRSEENKRAG